MEFTYGVLGVLYCNYSMVKQIIVENCDLCSKCIWILKANDSTHVRRCKLPRLKWRYPLKHLGSHKTDSLSLKQRRYVTISFSSTEVCSPVI